MKILLKLIFVSFIITFCSNCSNSQIYSATSLKTQVAKKPKNLNQKMLISIGTMGKDMKNFVRANNLTYVKFMDENRSIDRDNYLLDRKKFEFNLIKQFPNKNDKGICYIDFESPFINDVLFQPINSPSFHRALNIYLEAYKLAKEIRPHVTFGYYHIPFSNSPDGNYWDANEKITSLLKIVDVYFPSVYLYSNNENLSFFENYEYVNENIKVALKYGKLYNKKVYPFVMHRYYSSDKKMLFLEITNEQWEEYLQMVSTSNYDQNYVNGVVWWGADDYYFDKVEGKNIVGPSKFLSKEQFINSNDKTLIKKATIFKSVLGR